MSDDPSKLSNPQMQQLKAQIIAYRFLARNQHVPAQIFNATKDTTTTPGTTTGVISPTSQQQQQHPQQQQLTAPNSNSLSRFPRPAGVPLANGQAPQVPQPQTTPPVATSQPATPTPNTTPAPSKTPLVTSPMPKQNKLTPVEKPSGLDPLLLLNERENRLNTRITYRLQCLSQLPTSMAEDLQDKATLELRALRLLNFQRQLRQEVVGCMSRDATLETSYQLKAYKRSKRQGLREARATERLEKQQKLEAERKKKQKHQEFLNAVLQHGKDLREYHKNNQLKTGRINKSVILYHLNKEREEKKEQERIEKERMRRLMAEDEEGYRKLIDQKKDKRLAFLLAQTDEYIANLTEMVKQHKQEQRKKMKEQRKQKKMQRLEQAVEGGVGEVEKGMGEDSRGDLQRVTVIETATGKVKSGEEAPTAQDLQKWLEGNPGWAAAPREDSEEMEEDDGDDAGTSSEDEEEENVEKKKEIVSQPQQIVTVKEFEEDPEKMPDEQAKEVIQKAKAEDDEYKNQGSEQIQTYYG